MEKPTLKICAHFKPKNLKFFEETIYNRKNLYCDVCYSSHKFRESKEGLDLSNLLVCLNCFKICCNRYTQHQCMLTHGLNSNHHVTYSLSSGSMWCYGCDYELKEFQIEKGLNGNAEEIKKVLNEYSGENKKAYQLIEYTKKIDDLFNKLVEKNRQMMIKQQSDQIDQDNKHIKEKEKPTQGTIIYKITLSSNPETKNKITNFRFIKFGKHMFF